MADQRRVHDRAGRPEMLRPGRQIARLSGPWRAAGPSVIGNPTGGASRRSTEPPNDVLHAPGPSLLRSGEREHAAHAEPGGVPIGPRQADQRGRFEAERVRPHRRLSLSVGFVYARTAPAKQRQLFARGSYLPGPSKRAWNRSSIWVRQDSAEGEPAPGPTAAGCWPLAAR